MLGLVKDKPNLHCKQSPAAADAAVQSRRYTDKTSVSMSTNLRAADVTTRGISTCFFGSDEAQGLLVPARLLWLLLTTAAAVGQHVQDCGRALLSFDAALLIATFLFLALLLVPLACTVAGSRTNCIQAKPEKKILHYFS